MRGALIKYLHLSKRPVALLALSAGLVATALVAQDGSRPSATKQREFTPDETFFTYKTTNLEKITENGRTVMHLARQKDTAPDGDDLILDFESSALFANPAHQRWITQANLEREEHAGMSGQAAVFNLPEHKLKIALPDYLHLSGRGQHISSGDLSFACEFEPHSGNGEILRRENFFNGVQYLFSIALHNGRIQIKLENLLQPNSNDVGVTLDSATLTSVDKIKLRKRNYLVFTYSESSATLRLLLNGREQAVYNISHAVKNSILSFRQLGAAPVILFSPFRGYADNIVFSNQVLPDDDAANFGAVKPYGDRYDQRRGYLWTSVYDMRFSASTINAITADFSETKEDGLILKARCHNKKFSPGLTDQAMPFENIDAWQNRKCRFIQFKAEFVADNSGEKSPTLKNISLAYRENPPPDAPLKPKIVKASSETITLEIPPNTELDIVKGGRYIVYYGHKKRKPEGAIFFKSGAYVQSRFKGEVIAHRSPIQIQISNETIALNKSWSDKNPRFKNRYPIFESGIGFYFWVTACDDAYSEAQEFADHESRPSVPVFHRF